MTIEKAASELCPCGTGLAYGSCCRPLLADGKLADSPEMLMRSRFTAFYMQNIGYLLSSVAVECRNMNDRAQIESTMQSVKWLSLKVIASQLSPFDPKGAWVEFAAFYQQGANIQQLHEKSFFVQREKRWYYLKGDILPPRIWGRNEPCWCGKGKKYKKCHG